MSERRINKPKRVGANVAAPPAPDAQLLTFGEAAWLLRVSTTTVRRLVDQGKLTGVAVLSRTLIARDELESFVRRSQVTHVPDSDPSVILAAQEKARQAQRRRSMVVADWNTGKDHFGDESPKLRPRFEKKGGQV